MSDTVPPAALPEDVAACDVTADMWLFLPSVTSYPLRVDYVHQSDVRTLLVVELPDAMDSFRFDPSDLFRPATEAEVEAEGRRRARSQMADRLSEFASVLRRVDLPYDRAVPTLNMSLFMEEAQLTEVADLLGLPIENSHGKHHAVTWPAGAEYGEFTVQWSGYYDPAPVEHKLGGGVADAGQNDVYCTCGVEFNGFATPGAAMAELNAHIAAETTGQEN